jgi:alkylation response protein AidB-like acyl-CoA dehydrogenase
MPIAISEDHRSLAEVADSVLTKRQARAAARSLLESDDDSSSPPALWNEFTSLGWLGLHLPENYGGSGFGLEELAVVVEQLGRHVAPGPFVPTVIASAVIDATADEATKSRLLPGLAGGEVTAAVAVNGEVTVADGTVTGSLSPVLAAAAADLILAVAGDDVVIIEVGPGVSIETPANLDPARRSGRVTFDNVPVTVLAGARSAFADLARTILAAEAVGVAVGCTEQAAEYAKQRVAFGRPIGMFQAVKHHCANMYTAAELATAAVWDAARAAASGGEQFAIAAAAAAALAGPAAYLCANLNTQVHGGIGYTWEHDAHLYLRRALVLQALLDVEMAAAAVTDLARRSVRREKSIELPPEAAVIREEVRAFANSAKGLSEDKQRRRLIDTGYLRPNWPRPWGRAAGAVEQLVIEQEFKAAGIQRPLDVITGYVMLTLIQQADSSQVARWVPSALAGEEIWCQLFSEPDAGSDAANIKTRGTRTEGGWLLSGQKVWTSGATRASKGIATVRTDPDAPKHKGVTMMVVDMKAPGVEIRPLRQPDGGAHFCEVFLNDVFVPDENVVGPVNEGWKVARATLGNESISIGGDESGMSTPGSTLIDAFDAHPDRLPGGQARIGRYIAGLQASGALNLRSGSRAVLGAGPGPEGAIAKLVLTELGHEVAAMMALLGTPELVFLSGEGEFAARINFTHRILAIGGGTSEIKRNQIGERILGLPRDPVLA